MLPVGVRAGLPLGVPAGVEAAVLAGVEAAVPLGVIVAVAGGDALTEVEAEIEGVLETDDELDGVAAAEIDGVRVLERVIMGGFNPPAAGLDHA